MGRRGDAAGGGGGHGGMLGENPIFGEQTPFVLKHLLHLRSFCLGVKKNMLKRDQMGVILPSHEKKSQLVFGTKTIQNKNKQKMGKKYHVDKFSDKYGYR